MATIQAGHHVAFLCNDEASAANQQLINQLKNAVSHGSVTICKPSESHSLSPSTSDVVFSRSQESHTLEGLFELFRILRGDGCLYLLEPLANRTFEMSEALNRNLTLAGFISPKITTEGDSIQISCTKPNWEMGASQGIRIKKKPVWTKDQNDQELVDESSLLAEDDLVKPSLVAASDCSVAKKACKNCTCGRAEREANGEDVKPRLTLQMLENPGQDSSCGSCGLGDAFRCAGCPYRGLPAFTPGQKIVLPDDFFSDF